MPIHRTAVWSAQLSWGSLAGLPEFAPAGNSFLPLKEFNALVDIDSVTWRSVTGRNSLSDLNPSNALLMNFCANHRLFIMKTMFENMGVYKCTWHWDTLGCRSMIDFVAVSSDLWLYDLGTWVKRGA